MNNLFESLDSLPVSDSYVALKYAWRAKERVGPLSVPTERGPTLTGQISLSTDLVFYRTGPDPNIPLVPTF